MTITVYNNTSDVRQLTKNLIALNSYSARMVEPFNTQSPSFIVSYDTMLLSKCNYLYCQETERYYFVNSIEVLTGGRIQINCNKVDVLMSFTDDIKNLMCLCVRNETQFNHRIIDKDFPTTGDTHIRTVRFDNTSLINPSESSENFVVIVSGSKES